MEYDIKHCCDRVCSTCKFIKNTASPHCPTMSMSLADEVNDTLAVDITGPFTITSNGNKYTLAITDRYNQMKFAYPLVDQQSKL